MHEIVSRDGRRLEVLTDGPEDGFPLVFHHGTPQGAVPFGVLNRPAADRGLRVIAYSRPGYGGSTARADAVVADDAQDVADILDALGYDEFVTLGWSGGGPRAIACAAMLPGRCRAAASGAGIAPPDAAGLDLLAGMGPENVEEFTAAFEGKAALTAWLDANSASVFEATAEQIVAAFGELVPDVDKAALTGELAEHLAASFRAAGRQGITGWLDDDLMLVRPWGFDLSAIEVPVAIWQGTEDLMVPFSHAQWLADHVRGASAHLVEGQGHFSLISRMDLVLADLLDLAHS